MPWTRDTSLAPFIHGTLHQPQKEYCIPRTSRWSFTPVRSQGWTPQPWPLIRQGLDERTLVTMGDTVSMGLLRMPTVKRGIVALIVAPEEAIKCNSRCAFAQCKVTDDYVCKAYNTPAHVDRLGKCRWRATSRTSRTSCCRHLPPDTEIGSIEGEKNSIFDIKFGCFFQSWPAPEAGWEEASGCGAPLASEASGSQNQFLGACSPDPLGSHHLNSGLIIAFPMPAPSLWPGTHDHHQGFSLDKGTITEVDTLL